MSHPALMFDEVSYSVPAGFWRRDRTLVHALEICLPKGEVLGLVGPNGAGKTTTIKLAAGLVRPSAGVVRINGAPSTEERARRCIGLVTETQYVYPHLKLREWLSMMGGLSGLKGADLNSRVEAVLERLELSPQADQMMLTLSKGQLQRAGISQALIHGPDILFLDEPMSGLDPYWRYRLMTLLRGFKEEGGTILFSSHILADVERLSDQVILIQGGRIRWAGRFSDMPRDIKSYEVICRTAEAASVQRLAQPDEPVLQPKGEWTFKVPIHRKQEVLKLASEGIIDIEALQPVREEIEEVLFGFGGKEE